MDDYSVTSLNESKNEWTQRLLNILTPCIITEINGIFKESYNDCVNNDEEDKYLMTFQICLSSIPKWNKTMVEEVSKKISQKCKYLEELITCVHIIQLKSLTCVRVSNTQKKVDIDIPCVGDFIHKVFTNVARKLYTNIYLFEMNISPLQIQKHNRELEIIIKECILNTIRETMPIEHILKSYIINKETIIVDDEVVLEKPNENEKKDDDKDDEIQKQVLKDDFKKQDINEVVNNDANDNKTQLNDNVIINEINKVTNELKKEIVNDEKIELPPVVTMNIETETNSSIPNTVSFSNNNDVKNYNIDDDENVDDVDVDNIVINENENIKLNINDEITFDNIPDDMIV